MVVGMNTHTSMKRIEFYTVICIQGCYDYGHYKSYIKLMVLAWFTKLKQGLTSYHITCSLSPFSSIHSPSSQWPGWLTMSMTEWRKTFYWTEQIFRFFLLWNFNYFNWTDTFFLYQSLHLWDINCDGYIQKVSRTKNKM